MATKLGLYLALNLLFAGAAHGCASYDCGQTDPTPPAEPAPSTPYSPEPPTPPAEPTPSTYTPEPPTSTTPATHDHRPARGCPKDALKLKLCASVLGGLVNVMLQEDQKMCCQLLEGLADIDAAACLCTVLKADVLDISLRVPIDISIYLNKCGRKSYFTCAPRH
nr:unnamed protein product [Digitaria exilis]